MPKRAEMTADEIKDYLDAYFATVDTLNAALTKFQTLATLAQTPEDASRYNAEVLLARRELELITNKRRAFQADTASVNPPDAAAVQRAKDISARVAEVQVKTAQFTAIVQLMADGLTEFAKIHPAT